MPIVRLTSDPREFERIVGPLVEADPVMHSVIATNLARCVQHDVSDALWLWLEHARRPIAAAMHTPQRGAYIATEDPGQGSEFARALLEVGTQLDAVSGDRGGVEGFAEAWTDGRRLNAQTTLEQATMVLGELRPPRGVEGSFRPARIDDTTFVNEWMSAFQLEALGESGEQRYDDRVADGRVGLWEADGRPVSVAYSSAAFGGVSRVSGVYTPPEYRGHGYASACVAEVSRRVVERGHRCMLYVDRANPTSNAIYAAIGYRLHGDTVNVRFVRPD